MHDIYLIYSPKIFYVIVSFVLWEIIKMVVANRVPNPSRKAKGEVNLVDFWDASTFLVFSDSGDLVLGEQYNNLKVVQLRKAALITATKGLMKKTRTKRCCRLFFTLSG